MTEHAPFNTSRPDHAPAGTLTAVDPHQPFSNVNPHAPFEPPPSAPEHTAPEFVAGAVSEVGFAERTQLEVAKPAGVVAGMIVLVAVYVEVLAVVVKGAGFTVNGAPAENAAAAFQLVTLRKIDDGSPGPYIFEWGATKHGCTAAALAYSGQSEASPINAVEQAPSPESRVIERGPSINTTTDHTRIVMFGVNNTGNVGEAATPAAMTRRVAGAAGIVIADAILPAAGASGNKDVILTAANQNAGQLLALTPAK